MVPSASSFSLASSGSWVKYSGESDELLEKFIEKTAKSELGYRGLKLEINDCLMDTFKASACIMSRGNIDKKDFELYSHGIKSISAFIINSKWNGETSCIQAAKIMYLTACLIKNIPLIKKIPQQEPIKGLYSKLNFIRK